MIEIVPGIHRVGGFPFSSINAYLVGDTLIDAGTRLERRYFLRTLNPNISRVNLKMAHGKGLFAL